MNLDGPVWVAKKAAAGTATVTLSFDRWKEAKVAPTTHFITVAPARPGPKTEPVAENLVATLVHPDRKATVSTLKFSNDGQRLFVAGYPSGVVQIFDLASRQEVRRIETRAGYRGTSDYAYLSPDWKSLYVPIEQHVVKEIERDGKKTHWSFHSGRYRVWDVTTGEEKAALRPEAGHAPVLGSLSPGGSLLISTERQDFDLENMRKWNVIFAWDLKTGQRTKLIDGFGYARFSQDGKFFATDFMDQLGKKSAIRIHDTATLKETARLDCPEKDRLFYLDEVSPDGKTIAISLFGKLGAPREVWFRDARTLEDRGRFVGTSEPEGYGGGHGRFTPDGKYFIILDMSNKVVVWDVAARKVARTFEVETRGWDLAISPNSQTLAVAWKPKSDVEPTSSRDTDARDYPQPRITLFDLVGDKPPRTLILPHGFTTALAFSPDGKTLASGDQGGVRLFDLSR